MPASWGLEEAERLDGRVAVITGANSGLGLATASALRGLGAQVVLACRNVEKADAAALRMVAGGPGPAPLVVRLDLESLDSVSAAADELARTVERVDLLVNNAGLMGPPGPDSVRRQLWSNHLGHVALTSALLPTLSTSEGRVVVVSSMMHRRGSLSASAPLAIEQQRPMIAYGSTKLMNLLFCFEGDRRLRAARSTVSMRAAHPGNSRSELGANGVAKGRPGPISAVVAFATDRLAQSTDRGALPTLRAALDPSIPPGGFVGPSGPLEMFGDPVPVQPSKQATDRELATAVFDASLEVVGASWPS
jgi:NAD(P)-dependent dehydrogenase (short-subunit alcohol dehydrogenase family)